MKFFPSALVAGELVMARRLGADSERTDLERWELRDARGTGLLARLALPNNATDRDGLERLGVISKGAPMPTPNRATVETWMVARLLEGEYIDRHTNEVELTAIVEGAAQHFEQDAWLDDEEHWVWDAPMTAVKRARKAGSKARLPGDE